MPYLPMDSRSPMDHSCVGRNLKGQRPSPPHLATRHCEIPASAGMVCGGNGSVGANPPLVAAIDDYLRPANS